MTKVKAETARLGQPGKPVGANFGIKWAFLGILAFLGSGCSLLGPTANMTPEQINALAKIKDAGAVCVAGHGPPLSGGGAWIMASVDKGIKATLEVTPDCGIKIRTE